MSCYSFFDKANDGVKVIDRVLGKEISFWDKYGSAILGITIPLAVFLVGFLLYFLELHLSKRKEEKAKRMITLNGVSIDSAKVCSVSLVGFQEITIVKGTEFVAPLHEKESFDFGGWFYDTACTEPYKTKRIKKSITLYPKWTKDS